ncbi:MAG: hypothetical protein HYU69_13300 [Bacteroidetes bacterium]|nr:hypothetical protein [Bacteroidota bacterium]
MDTTADNNKDFFDPQKYKTLIVGQEKGNKSTSDIISLLINSGNAEEREDALRSIKKEPAALELLINAINDKNLSDYKTQLIAACWESGIDCRTQLNYFVNLAINEDYLSCIEATSVIDGMDPPLNQDELSKSAKQLHEAIIKAGTDKKKLLEQLAEILTTYKNN